MAYKISIIEVDWRHIFYMPVFGFRVDGTYRPKAFTPKDVPPLTVHSGCYVVSVPVTHTSNPFLHWLAANGAILV